MYKNTLKTIHSVNNVSVNMIKATMFHHTHGMLKLSKPVILEVSVPGGAAKIETKHLIDKLHFLFHSLSVSLSHRLCLLVQVIDVALFACISIQLSNMFNFSSFTSCPFRMFDEIN